jgi:asparagine N-glycosylation enzyme membrane subunit Stt3
MRLKTVIYGLGAGLLLKIIVELVEGGYLILALQLGLVLLYLIYRFVKTVEDGEGRDEHEDGGLAA